MDLYALHKFKSLRSEIQFIMQIENCYKQKIYSRDFFSENQFSQLSLSVKVRLACSMGQNSVLLLVMFDFFQLDYISSQLLYNFIAVMTLAKVIL